MKGLVTRYLHVKYQSPTPYSSRDIAQVKVLSTDDDDDDNDDAEGMALALRTFSSRRAKNKTHANVYMYIIDILYSCLSSIHSEDHICR